MAKILYGVSGEGSGHSSRAREIISHLEKRGHKVKVVSYDRGYNNLKNEFNVDKIEGLRFSFKENKISYLETTINNIINVHGFNKSFVKIIKIIKNFKPELIITDFEPLTAAAANLKKIPLISLDNQHRINMAQVDYPKKYKKDFLTAKTIIDLMVYGAKEYLVTSFYRAKVKNNRTFLFAPLLREEVLKEKIKDENYILVYITSKFEGLNEILKSINKRFVVYGLDKQGREKNITFKKPSNSGFLKDLANSQGVIATAGFTLISEALYLGKPYLAMPIGGQFEQILNGHNLEKQGFGKSWETLDKEKIESFLYNLDLYKKNIEKKYKKEGNEKILKKIDQLVEKYS